MSNIELLKLLEEKNKRISESILFYKYFIPNTKYSIDNYKKHEEFFKNGATAKQRLLMAGNRVGKTEAAAYEIVCHAIGWYPSWWQGKRYPPEKELTIWVAGDTNKNVREIIQKKFLGGSTLSTAGTGIIPKRYIEKITRGHGVNELADIITVKKINNNGKKFYSEIHLKTYQGGRETFQGTAVDIIWLDEEAPFEVYTECALRTMTTNGLIILTFTPLKGLTELITNFYNSNKEDPENYKITTATWEDVPHLDEKTKKELLLSIPEFQRDARQKGIPQLGSGAIYRVSLDDILVDNFEIPDHWKKVYALDVGWNTTACLWGAINPDNNIIYIYDELYVHKKQPHEYARMIKDRGSWIEGVVDSASNASSQADGRKIKDLLTAEGLKLHLPNKSVEAGIYKVWEKLTYQKIKVFKSCFNFQDEYKVYRRDEKGNIIKEKDHLMDCLRYLIMSGIEKAKTKMETVNIKKEDYTYTRNWMN